MRVEAVLTTGDSPIGCLRGGAGGTRTHGRRIMSPLRILAVLVFLRSSWAFSLLRAHSACPFPGPFVSLFLSLRPQRVPNASSWGRTPAPGEGSRQLGPSSETRPQRILLPTRRGSGLCIRVGGIRASVRAGALGGRADSEPAGCVVRCPGHPGGHREAGDVPSDAVGADGDGMDAVRRGGSDRRGIRPSTCHGRPSAPFRPRPCGGRRGCACRPAHAGTGDVAARHGRSPLGAHRPQPDRLFVHRHDLSGPAAAGRCARSQLPRPASITGAGVPYGTPPQHPGRGAPLAGVTYVNATSRQ